MKKLSIALIAAATFATGGFAVAQTSTPGAGCTATANAMRGGNLGSTATNKDCTSTPSSTAAATTTTTTTTATPMTSAAPSTSTTTSQMAPSTTMAQAAPERATRTRAARADRN